jgi:excisionase family DNA binding protein
MAHGEKDARHEWMTVKDVAALLKVSEETVRRWVRVGELPALALGKKAGFRIRPADLEIFIAARYGLGSKEAA